jgi:hypothetical protein
MAWWSSLQQMCFILCAVVLYPPLSQAAERGLLEPDWNDAGVARARENLAPEPRARSLGERSLSLPQWGFGKNITAPDGNERARARSIGNVGSSMPWPPCASPSPTTEHTRDDTATWYSDSYDFGCLHITVSGDRAYTPDLKVPAAPKLEGECSNLETRALGREQPEGDRQGRFELQLRLNAIPYTISGECFKGAEDFCRDRSAQCALINRLILLGGNKQ